jgi:hypothetical protein
MPLDATEAAKPAARFAYEFQVSRVKLGKVLKMRQPVTRKFAVVLAATILFEPAVEAAQARDRSGLTVEQTVDRADARIAGLKASLRLSSDQAQHWPQFQSALHDIAADRAKSRAASHLRGPAPDLRTGRASSQPTIESEEAAAQGRSPADYRVEPAVADAEQPTDIDDMLRDADRLAGAAAELRKVANAAKPLYDTLDDAQPRRLVRFVLDDLVERDRSERR